MTISRTPLFFGAEQRSLFGWYHAPGELRRELAVVICPPFGHDYIESHRSLRHFADALAEQGIAALRFDYDGTGDSAGGDTEAARVAAWRESIVSAVRTLAALSDCERIALAGLRLGATLAASVASEIDVAALVLWEPYLRGGQYVEEMKSRGFLLTADTQHELGRLDIAAHLPKTRPLFVATHDDDAADIVNWLTDVAGVTSTVAIEAPDVRVQQTIGELRETLVQFGANDSLFGIISEPLRPARAAAATIVLPNAGSSHHVGPNRIHVFLARALSRAGFRVLRFDLSGLGDSDDAPDALPEAIRMLDQQRSPSSFVLIGLCSGADVALRAALELTDVPIVESILINPLTFSSAEELPREAVSLARTIVERLGGKRPQPNGLERDLTRIAESGRKLIFLFSRSEPGFDLLMANASHAVKHFRRRGLIDVWRSDAATHTFEERQSREVMIESLVRHLAERYLA